METIDFYFNWNNKLDCNSFTTFRIHNPSKYKIGNQYAITLKDKKIKEAELVAMKQMKLKDVNEFIAHIDTGYSKAEFTKTIMKMYKNKIKDFDAVDFVLLLLVSDKASIIEPSAANHKIAMFCRKYEQYLNMKYKTSAADSGKIKIISINEELLDHYFTSNNFLFKNKYSIANLAKYYNELLIDKAAQSKGSNISIHPNQWNKQHAQKLDGAGLSSYYQHLLALGLVPKKDARGNILDYVKPEHLNQNI